MGLVVFAADAGSRGWRGGMAVGERDAAVRGGLTAVVALAASARARNCERHIPVLPRGGLDLGHRLGVGGVARGSPRGLGAGRGGARRDARGGRGLAGAVEWGEVGGAARVTAAAGGDVAPDGGHVLGFLFGFSLSEPLPLSWLVGERGR